jgi:hypothetical protein
VFIRDKLALAQKLMEEKTVSLNEADRRAQHADIGQATGHGKHPSARPRAKSRSKS